MLELFGFWLVEELLPDGELVVDFFLAEAEVGDVEESYACARECMCCFSAWAWRYGGGWDSYLPIWCTASFNCTASFCFPSGVSNWDKSNETRSAQSTI